MIGDLILTGQTLQVEVSGGAVATIGDLVRITDLPNLPENTYRILSIEQLKSKTSGGGRAVMVLLSRDALKIPATSLTKI